MAEGRFELLDLAHAASLRLITDVVNEDDALCLALTCRALRDALWARFPTRPAGDTHAGARVRTRNAAVVGTAGRLAWALDLNQPWPGPRVINYDIRDQICETVARHGALASLQWLRADGRNWKVISTCIGAAKGGHLAAL